MITFRARKLLPMAILVTVLTACSREQQDWRSAEAADTLDAYSQFLRHHPDSELATQARARLVQLTEDRDWQRAGAADTAEGYRQFLAQHPNGKWAQEARIRIQNFALGEAPTPASVTAAAIEPQPKPTPLAAPSPATPPGFPQSAPGAPAPAVSAKPAATPSTSAPNRPERGTPPLSASAAYPPGTATHPASQQPTAPTTGYAVQLGAFSSEAGANSQWQQLSAHFGPELQGLAPRVVVANTDSGRLYRLQAPVADEARARAVCEALKQRSQPCVPVLP